MNNTPDLLAALLVLVTDGKKTAENIQILQEKISDHDRSKIAAIKSRDDAEKKEKDLKSLMEKFDVADNLRKEEDLALENKRKLLDADIFAFEQKKKEHIDAVSFLSQEKTVHDGNVQLFLKEKSDHYVKVKNDTDRINAAFDKVNSSQLQADQIALEAEKIKTEYNRKLDDLATLTKR